MIKHKDGELGIAKLRYKECAKRNGGANANLAEVLISYCSKAESLLTYIEVDTNYLDRITDYRCESIKEFYELFDKDNGEDFYIERFIKFEYRPF